MARLGPRAAIGAKTNPGRFVANPGRPGYDRAMFRALTALGLVLLIAGAGGFFVAWTLASTPAIDAADAAALGRMSGVAAAAAAVLALAGVAVLMRWGRTPNAKRPPA